MNISNCIHYRSDCDEDDIEHFLTFKSYDDSITVNILASAANIHGNIIVLR